MDAVNGALTTENPVIVGTPQVRTYQDSEGFTSVLRKKKCGRPGKEESEVTAVEINIPTKYDEKKKIQKPKGSGFEFISSKLSFLN
jgi:hypothetical protein